MLAAAFRDGMQTLLRDGIRKAVEGLTTYRQVRAVAAK
jgi:type II secretory ATPase GspE/PulE/Tfp pilus assembly ATPase PilB-like protein